MTKFTVVFGDSEYLVEADKYSAVDVLEFYVKPAEGGQKTIAIFRRWDVVIVGTGKVEKQ